MDRAKWWSLCEDARTLRPGFLKTVGSMQASTSPWQLVWSPMRGLLVGLTGGPLGPCAFARAALTMLCVAACRLAVHVCWQCDGQGQVVELVRRRAPPWYWRKAHLILACC